MKRDYLKKNKIPVQRALGKNHYKNPCDFFLPAPNRYFVCAIPLLKISASFYSFLHQDATFPDELTFLYPFGYRPRFVGPCRSENHRLATLIARWW